MTLTEARLNSGIIVVPSGENGTSTNCRRIPYAERYRASSAVQETPAQYLQKAAQDEEQRRRNPQVRNQGLRVNKFSMHRQRNWPCPHPLFGIELQHA